MRGQFADCRGAGARQRPRRPGRQRGQRYQLVLGGGLRRTGQWRDRVLARMEENPGIMDPTDYRRPGRRCGWRSTAAGGRPGRVGAVGRTLETMMGSRRVTTFVEDGGVQVMVRAGREARIAGRPGLTYVRSRDDDGACPPGNPGRDRRAGHVQPLQPAARDHHQRRPRAGTAWARRSNGPARWRELPEYAQIDWKGETAVPACGRRGLVTFTMALLIVYLVLAAQFGLHPSAGDHAHRAPGGAGCADRAVGDRRRSACSARSGS